MCLIHIYYLILSKFLWERYHCYLCLTNQKTEESRDLSDWLITCGAHCKMNMQGLLLKNIKTVKTDSAGLNKGALESKERHSK